MSKMSVTGSEMRRMDTFPRGNKPEDLRDWVLVQDQAIRELIPGPLLSDESRTFYVDALTKIASEVGPERFRSAVLNIIDDCDRRPTIAMFRKIVGLKSSNAAIVGWRVVTEIVSHYIIRDSSGSVRIGSRTVMRDGVAFSDAPPEVTQSVKMTVDAMGGWKSLVDAYPEWWPQRWAMFKEMYEDSPTSLTKTLQP